MTSLVVRKMIGGGAVKLEQVSVICPACGQQVKAVATDGRIKGYCAVARQSVDFLVETQPGSDPECRAKMGTIRKKLWQDPEYRAKQSAAVKKVWQDPEYRAKQKAAMKKRGQDPEYRAKLSTAAKKRYQDPEYRAKMRAARARRHNKRE